jgi:hypothetical protein
MFFGPGFANSWAVPLIGLAVGLWGIVALALAWHFLHPHAAGRQVSSALVEDERGYVHMPCLMDTTASDVQDAWVTFSSRQLSACTLWHAGMQTIAFGRLDDALITAGAGAQIRVPKMFLGMTFNPASPHAGTDTRTD